MVNPGAAPGVRLTRVRRLAGLAAALALAASAAITSPAHAASVGSQLASGAVLLPGSSIESPGGAYQLTMLPTGNLTETGPSGQLWATYTSSPGAYLINQPAGDLVLLTAAGAPIWSTGTSAEPGPGAPAAAAIAFAKKQIGKPYRYGGAGPASYDCSGLVEAAYAAAGVSIPRTSQQQYKQGQVIAASARQPGDLVFYNSSTAPTHVAIYLGNSQIIESLKPGTYVRIDSVT